MFYIHFDAEKYQARKAMQETLSMMKSVKYSMLIIRCFFIQLFWIFGMNTEF